MFLAFYNVFLNLQIFINIYWASLLSCQLNSDISVIFGAKRSIAVIESILVDVRSDTGEMSRHDTASTVDCSAGNTAIWYGSRVYGSSRLHAYIAFG